LGEAFSEAGALNVDSTGVSTSSADSISPQLNPLDEVPGEAAADVGEVEQAGDAEVAAGDAEVAAGDAEVAAEEARRPTMRRAPVEPTTQEIAEHNLTHLPFRSWCPCCVAAKAKQWPHRKSTVKEDAEETVPSVHMDYWFMRDVEVAENVTVINFKEKNTKMYGAHVVRKKGTENEEAARIIKDIEKMGSKGKIIVKTDQENSILAVAKEIQRLRTEETVLEASKIYDSQSNGVAERAVQSVECQVRTMLLALQKRLDVKVPVTHKIVTWLVEHAADMLNKFAVGPDGRTAFERIKGKKYRGEVVEFGRKIFYKIPCKPEGGLMTERWVPGIWLGKRFLSDEHLVGVEDGSVCVSSSVRLMPDSESWSVDWVNKILGTPWCPKGSGPGSEEDTAVEVIPAGNPLDVGHPQPRKPRQEGAPRDVYITKEHIVKFGYTASCIKCRAIREGFQVTRGHSSLCRERIMEALRSDDGSKELLEKAEAKNLRYLARAVEDADRDAKKRKLNESRLAQAPATSSSPPLGTSSSSTARIPPEERNSEAADGTAVKQQKVVQIGAPEPRKREHDGDEEELSRPTQYQATMDKPNEDSDVQMEAVKLLNKVKYQECLKERHESAKNILEKDPHNGEPWNICAKKSRKVAKEYLQKWKPQMLHLEVSHGAKMEAALDLVEVQRLAGRKFVLVGQLQSSSWTAPAAKRILKMFDTTQVIVNSRVGRGADDACRHQRRGACGCSEVQGQQEKTSGSECGCVSGGRGVHGPPGEVKGAEELRYELRVRGVRPARCA
jgi:hypothetical protein